MRVFLGLVVFAAFVVHAAVAKQAADEQTRWEWLNVQVTRSLGRVVGYDGETPVQTCSAFSINEDRRYWMTAFHCLAATSMTVDEQIAWVIFKSEKHDLAVLEVPGTVKPALHMADEDAIVGQPVATFGFAYGFPLPQMRRGMVALAELAGEDTEIDGMSPDTSVTVFDTGWAGGISGGPVVNRDGRVVSIAQLEHSGRSGMGRPLHTIRAQTGQFWEKD